jgi:hypothetical protein
MDARVLRNFLLGFAGCAAYPWCLPGWRLPDRRGRQRSRKTALQIVEPKPEFRDLSEADLQAALADPNPANPVAAEVARLIDDYVANCQTHIEQLGRIPESVIHVKPRWPIEAFAMRYLSALGETLYAQDPGLEEMQIEIVERSGAGPE